MKSGQKTLRWVVVFAILFSLMQLIPTLFPYTLTTEKTYLGFESTIDAYFYAAFVNDAKDHFLLENRHTSEPQLRRYVLPLFNVLGIFAHWLDIASVFLVDRFLQAIFFLLSMWYFLGIVFTKAQERLWAYFFIPLAGGLGWLVAVLGTVIAPIARIKSYDLTYWMGYSLMGHLYLPHRYWAFGLALIGFAFMVTYSKTRRLKYLVASGILLPIIFLLHPVTALFFALTLALMQVIEVLHEGKITRQRILVFANFLLSAIPILGLMLWARQDPVVAAQQSVYFFTRKVEPLPFYFIGYGMLLILSLISLTKSFYLKPKSESVITSDTTIKSLVFAWILIALIFTQIGYGIEFMVFLHVVLALIAVHWLISIKERVPKAVLVTVVLFSVLSVPFVLAERTNRVINDPFAFITPNESDALDFLDTQPNGILLAPKNIGTIATWKIKQLPLSTHTYLTDVEYKKIKNVEKFYGGDTNALQNYDNIDYVWFGPESTQDRLDNRSLKRIYSNAQIRLYRVVSDQNQ